jgi:nucleotide-binding universal stress UspA family protein
MTKIINDIILVPVDFTETTMHAVKYAVNLADKSPRNFKLMLLHVINKESRSKLKKESQGLETIFEKLKNIKTNIQKEFMIEVDYVAKEGSIFEVINEVAVSIGASLMIVGTHGKKGLQNLFGSYAFRVIAHSPCSVIVIQNDSPIPKELGKVMFPVNIFTEPRQQVQHAIRMANNLGARIIIFTQRFGDDAANFKVKIITNQIENAFSHSNVQYEIASAEKKANFTDQLIEASKDYGVDLILMMTDSSIDNPDFNNSSWSESLIFNKAAIPVMCINPIYLGEIYLGL